MKKIERNANSINERLRACDVNLFDTMRKFSHLIPLPCTLFFDSGVPLETYVERCLQWIKSDAKDKSVILSAFPSELIYKIIARVCYENCTRCTPVQQDAVNVRLMFD